MTITRLNPTPVVALGAAASTVPTLIEELRYSNGRIGSAYITTAYTLNGVTVPTAWYNYSWIPHRYGGNVGDNCNFGTLLLSSMTSDRCDQFVLKYTNKVIVALSRLRGGYFPGDTFSISLTRYSGYISNGASGVYFSIPLDAPVYATDATATLTGAVRQNGYYLIGNGNENTNLATGYTVTVEVWQGKPSIGIIISKTTPITNATNNDSCAITLRKSTITFS